MDENELVLENCEKDDRNDKNYIKNTEMSTIEIICELSLDIKDFLKESALPIAEELCIEDIVEFLNVNI